MNEKNFKYVQWLLYGLMGISGLFTLLFYISPGSPDMLLYWMYIVLILSLVILLGSSVINILKNRQGSYKVLAIIVVIIILGFLSYVLSQNTYSPEMLEKAQISARGVKMVGAGLLMTYFIMIIAIGVFVYTSVYRFLK
jgi:hypothetical protein